MPAILFFVFKKKEMRCWAASDVLIVLVCAAAASSAQHDEDHGAEVRVPMRAARVRARKEKCGWVDERV